MRSTLVASLVALAALCGLLRAQPGDAAVFAQGAVAADHPVASEVGAYMLERGGHAVDAAIATALVLGVVNPFASGIGGGGFALVYDQEEGQTHALDFRETAPQAILREDFYPNGEHERMLSVVGGLAVGTPGEVLGMVALHERYGRIPWNELVYPAYVLAQRGFPAHALMIRRVEMLKQRAPDNYQDILDAMYVIDGELAEGVRVRRPKFARALELIRLHPLDAFYRGAIAEDIVQSVQKRGGKLSREDLAGYEVVWRTPLRAHVYGYQIDTFPLPSSGGVILQIALKGYEALQRAAGVPPAPTPFTSAEELHRFLHALTWGFAVRAEALGDPAFVEMDIEGFLSDATTQRIVESFDPERRLPVDAFSLASQIPDDSGTTHLSVIDREGNAVAFTSTVNTIFASRLVTERYGILLNNEMDDFATAPMTPNDFGLVGLEANAVRPGARPLSSMSPTLVLRDGKLIGSLGGSGGPRIITSTLQTLMRLVNGESATDAVEGERVHHQWIPETIELDASLEARLGEALRARGYTTAPNRWQAAVQAIWRVPGGWDAASDSSKDGAPAGARHGTRENHLRREQPAPISPP